MRMHTFRACKKDAGSAAPIAFLQADASGSPPFAFGKELGFCAHAHTSGLQESRRIGFCHRFPSCRRFGFSSFRHWKETRFLCACAQIEPERKPLDRPLPSVSFLPTLRLLLLPALERNSVLCACAHFELARKPQDRLRPSLSFLPARRVLVFPALERNLDFVRMRTNEKTGLRQTTTSFRWCSGA